MNTRLDVADRQRRIRLATPVLRRLARAVLRDRPAEYAELSLALVDDDTIRRLNAGYRGLDRVTDVLAFDLRTPADQAAGLPRSGEVIVSADRALAQARARRIALGRELARLFVHGLLHLHGHDHRRARERHAMRREEARIMRRIGGLARELVVTRRAPSSRRGGC